jgi:hypothetical protein
MRKELTKEQQRVIVDLICSAVKRSDNKLGERARAWEQAERMNQMYIPKAEAERRARENNEDMSYTKMTIPYSYAMLMAQHTYLASVFLSRNPILQYQGRNGTGQSSVLEMESVIDYQVENGGMAVAIYIALYDLLAYGVCAVFTTWADKTSYLTSYGKRPLSVNGVPVIEHGVPVEEDYEEVIQVRGYRGNEVFNCKPKDLIIDPSVGFINFQRGQFIGRRYQESVEVLQEGEQDGQYFNTSNLTANVSKESGIYGDNPALTETSSNEALLEQKAVKGFVNLYEVYMRVNPKALGLGINDRQEIWVFTVADKTTLINASPAGWLHGKFPVDLCTTEFDGYSLSSRGTPEIARPLNRTMDWLINSHMFNVEKAVNNEIIYDPSAINMRDFLDPRPGKRIRIRPEAYGRNPKDLIHQFSQYDYTKTHLQDVAFVESLFQRVFGINEQMLGAMASGGRKTATEVRSASGFALNRLKVFSEFISKQFFAPLSMKLVANSRQMYTTEDKFMIAENADSKEYREFTVDEIAGAFDYAPVDGSIPIDRFAMVALLKESLMAAVQLPGIAGRYDVARLFEHIMQMSGIKNMSSFEIQDDAQVKREAALGQLVVGGNQNVNTGREGGAAGEGQGGVEGVAPVSGMGVVG